MVDTRPQLGTVRVEPGTVLMLFAAVTDTWVFYGSYTEERSMTRMKELLTARYGYHRFHVLALPRVRGQGTTWS